MERTKEKSDWLILLLLAFVSAAVLLIGGVVYLSARPDPERGPSRTHLSHRDTEKGDKELGGSLRLDPSSELGPSGPLGSSGRPGPSEPRDSSSPPLGRQSASEAGPGSDEDEVDWELEMADSEELEPTPEMIEAERQKIREGRPSFGFMGRPGEGLSKIIRQRRHERRAENAGQATLSSGEDTEIPSESTVIEAGTAGAAAR